ncbi:hypothetical protein Tco_1007562 [Tanacetum coccineum]
MTEPVMEEYMMKTQDNYGSGVSRPKFDKDVKFELKGHDGASTRHKSGNTSNGLAVIQAQLNNLSREIKKVNERVYAAQVGCELFWSAFPQVGRYRAAAPRFYQMDNGNPSYPEKRQNMEESLNKFMVESAKRHDEHSSLIKEI